MKISFIDTLVADSVPKDYGDLIVELLNDLKITPHKYVLKSDLYEPLRVNDGIRMKIVSKFNDSTLADELVANNVRPVIGQRIVNLLNENQKHYADWKHVLVPIDS